MTSHPSKRSYSLKTFFITLLIFLVGFSLITIMYIFIRDYYNTPDWDIQIHRYFLLRRTPLLTNLLTFITNIFEPIIILAIVTIGSAIWAWRKKEFWFPLLLSLSLGSTFAISTIVKDLVERMRPPVSSMILPIETGFSFPSNHTIGITIIGLVIWYILYSKQKKAGIIISWTIFSSIVVAIVATSRIYLGYHWCTDVVASIGLAFVTFAMTVTLDRLYNVKRNKRALKNNKLSE